MDAPHDAPRVGPCPPSLGGEEFLVLLNVPNLEGLGDDNEPHGRVSVSIGAALIGPSDLDQSDDQSIARADVGLYEAKRAGRAGRNRVRLGQR